MLSIGEEGALAVLLRQQDRLSWSPDCLYVVSPIVREVIIWIIDEVCTD